MTHSLESVADCEDFIAGCLFMGTGGGGDPVEGRKALTAALDDGLTLRWHDADRIGDDVLTAMVYGIGSIAPRSDGQADALAAVRLDADDDLGDDTICEAVRELSEHLGQPIGCLVAAELGASNTPGPVVAAARLGIPIVDGDYSGRAIPEEMQSTPFVHGISSDPFAAVDRWGNTVIVKQAANPYMLERIARHIAMASFDGAAIASTPLSGREMKRVLVPGTLSLCLQIGRACRGATEAERDPVAAALEVVGGWRLFDGVVVDKTWEDSGGFMIGTLEIEGRGTSAGRSLRTWFKNETHVTWLDGQPWVCSPDLVTLVDPGSARGYTNTDIEIGDEVVAVGMAGLDAFRGPDALVNGTGPAYFGFDLPYVPIERLMQ
ncbi:DUF917 domain-containing protein [Candidatus Poriferisodalis sp.]|uniref:DUF917 domain-containing protein n=1 Tax=Candidatus Poriferisodalis sp. TaxID=3101277 RepID=UPI003B01D3C5